MTTCESRDVDLALHVRGDLPEPGRHELVAHLERCPRCRGVLSELADTQDALQSLAEEPLPDRALSAVRSRVLANAEPSAAGARWRRVQWWATAAAMIVGLGLVVGWLTMTWSAHTRLPGEPVDVSRAPAPPPVEAVAPASPDHTREDSHSPTGTAVARGASGRSASSGSPPPAPRPVEPAPPNGSEVLEAASWLTPEEADQLALAVLAMARIEELGVAGVESEGTEAAVFGSSPSPTGDVVHWTLSDPDVVIYWQLDSKGDES